MPAYNFRFEFVEKIKDGSKYTTIRRRRKHATKPGEMLSLYVGQRTKACRLVAKAPCVKVTPVVIYPFEMLLKSCGHVLPIQKTMKIAQVDGFEDLSSFFRFFERYGEPVLDDFEIIEWDPERLGTGNE